MASFSHLLGVTGTSLNNSDLDSNNHFSLSISIFHAQVNGSRFMHTIIPHGTLSNNITKPTVVMYTLYTSTDDGLGQCNVTE